jgi:hypothetical protein
MINSSIKLNNYGLFEFYELDEQQVILSFLNSILTLTRPESHKRDTFNKITLSTITQLG